MTEPIWFRLEGVCTHPEQVSANLWASGAAGVEIQDHMTFMEGGGIPPVPEGRARVIAFFESQEEIAAAPSIDGLLDPLWERFDDRSWETAWMAYFKPIMLSDRLIVGPPWEEFDAPDGGHKIVIEPGMAFGTGTHETTQLCAAALDRHLSASTGIDVLDVGCGSGILSMGARLLGASSVYGVDLTDDVIEIADANVASNGVDQIRFDTTPIDQIPGTYPLVLANILAHILQSISGELIAHTEPGGMLIMSGLTLTQEEGFRETFDVPDLTLKNRTHAGEWVCLEYQRA